MKKIKKILLAFAPISAIAIATPIVLTSCSVNSVGNESVKPDIKPDVTNGDNFKPKSEKFKAFEKEYSSSTSSNKDQTIEKHAKFLVKDNDGLDDVINMWSYNIWKTVKKSTKADESIKNNYKSTIDVVVKPNISNDKITTSFMFTSTTKNSEGKIVKATKKYENNTDGSGIEADKLSFKLKSIVQEYSIDGVDKKSELENNKSFYNLKDTSSDKSFIEGLKSQELTLNVKEILTKYEANKTMTWNTTKLGEIGTYDSNSNKLTIDLDTSKDKLEITKAMTKTQIIEKLIAAKSKFHNAIDNKPSEDVFNNKEDSFYLVNMGEKDTSKKTIGGKIQITSKSKLFNDLKLDIEITKLS